LQGQDRATNPLIEQIYRQQLTILNSFGVVVTAAGNDGVLGVTDIDDTIQAALGADFGSLIVVGSVDFTNQVSTYTSRSRQTGVLSTYSYGDYTWCASPEDDELFESSRGTSHAAAQVAGLASELLKQIPEGQEVHSIPGLVKLLLQQNGLEFRGPARLQLTGQVPAPLANSGVPISCYFSHPKYTLSETKVVSI